MTNVNDGGLRRYEPAAFPEGQNWRSTDGNLRRGEESMEIINSAASFGLVEVPSRIKETAAGVIVEAGTNGPQGGDRGCITYIRLQVGSHNAISLAALDGHGEEAAAIRCTGVEFSIEGDLELDGVIDALEFSAEVLKGQRKCAE